jgi:predicted MFS family arabinose efflux permease
VLWTGESVSLLGTAVSTICIPLLAVATLNASPFMVGLLATGSWLPWLLVGLAAGALTDRTLPRPVMVTCNSVSSALLLSVPVAHWLGVLTIWHLIVVALGVGFCGVFFLSAFHVYIPDVVAPHHLAAANSRLQGSVAATRLAGPGFGGLLAAAVGAAFGVLLNALTFLYSTYCLLRTKPQPRPPHPEGQRRTGFWQECSGGLRYLVADPYLRTIAVYAGTANLAAAALQAVEIVFTIREVGLNAGTVGVLIGLGGLGGVIGAAAAGRVITALGDARALVLAGVLTSPFSLLVPLTSRGWGVVFFLAGTIVPFIGLIVANVVIDSFRQGYCPRVLLGRMVASTRFISYGAGAIGAVAGGTVTEVFDVRTAIWAATAAQALCVVIVVLSPIGRLRVMPSAPVNAG